MVELDDIELFDRSVATLLESWRYFATGSPGAETIEVDGAAIAAFAQPPEREFLNNAVIESGCDDVTAALDGIERAYAKHHLDRYAVWVHESYQAGAAGVLARGYRLDSSTRTMAMPISELADVDTSGLDVFEPSLEEFWRVVGTEGFLPELDRERAHFYAARLEGESVATLMVFDHEGDCGIYMVGTLPPARRQGLASKLSAHAVRKAESRGCSTVSLQSTESMAEGVYGRVGLRDLGRFDECVPTHNSSSEYDEREPE